MDLEQLTQRYETQRRAKLFMQAAICHAVSHSDGEGRLLLAKRFDARTPELDLIAKAAVPPMGTTDPNPLPSLKPFGNAFLEMLAPQSAFQRIPWVPAPLGTSIAVQTGDIDGDWVSEAAPTPVVNFTTGRVMLPAKKIASIIAITKELAGYSSPSAQAFVERVLLRAAAKITDRAAFDPTKVGSMTNGAIAVPSSGVTGDQIAADVLAVLAALSGGAATRPYLITGTATARTLANLRTASGTPVFPTVTLTGTGAVLGVPQLVSPGLSGYVVGVDADQIAVGDDGVELETGIHGTLQMRSDPTNPITAADTLLALWSNDTIAIKFVRFINWARSHTNAAAYLPLA